MRGVHCPQCLGYRNISAYTVKGHEENIMESTNKKFSIAVAGTGDGDIIRTTKKNNVESGLLAA